MFLKWISYNIPNHKIPKLQSSKFSSYKIPSGYKVPKLQNFHLKNSQITKFRSYTFPINKLRSYKIPKGYKIAKVVKIRI